MRFLLIGTVLLSIAAAYYIYLPLPSTISEPWKLMIVDALIRGTMKLVRFCIKIYIFFMNAIKLIYKIALKWIYWFAKEICWQKQNFFVFLSEFCSSWPWTDFPVRFGKILFCLGGCKTYRVQPKRPSHRSVFWRSGSSSVWINCCRAGAEL